MEMITERIAFGASVRCFIASPIDSFTLAVYVSQRFDDLVRLKMAEVKPNLVTLMFVDKLVQSSNGLSTPPATTVSV